MKIKRSVSKTMSCWIFLAIIFPEFLMAQNNCKVLLDSISGQYDGGCKKGLASGEGTSKGIDQYTGEFKKGLPEGKGKYTFANGSIYEGEFKNGLRDGHGTFILNLSDGSKKTLTGYWEKGNYTGEYEYPYRIISKSSGVISAALTPAENKSGTGDILIVEISDKGRVQSTPDFIITTTVGSLISQYKEGLVTKVVIGSFPVGFMLHYKGEALEFLINKAGSYNMKLNFNKGIDVSAPGMY